ncbi:hypothetical protein DPEC_G00231850 [Dallia pectoralis]|uniref:Uncharacterized protein n=1 Tax=Dallia pectoralis TaxID=75939 RepID=A0ACC2FX05_DALPE|nr:hypothetical protein DPEC_G00231850 [Dallia pectoralis]
MASWSPPYKDCFAERGFHKGVGLDILFSTPENLYSPKEWQEPEAHYNIPRARPRSRHDWGTHSPPPQRSSTESRGDARPASLNPCQDRAHTLTLPHRALAVFKPGIYSSPQGYQTTTVDKPRMLKATITSSSSDSNLPVQYQSQDFLKQSRLNQQQQLPSFSPKTVHEENFSPKTVNQTSFSPKTVHHTSFSPKTVHHTSFSPKTVYRNMTTCQHKVNTITDSNTVEGNNRSHCNNIKSQVDMTSQNVFGQPCVRASLRSPHSSQQTHTDRNIEEALRRLITLDNTSEDPRTDASCRRSLSTEISLDMSALGFSQACSPVSDCPELDGLEGLSASELSLREDCGPGQTPPPKPGWSLEWTNLVHASEIYGEQRASELVTPRKPRGSGSEGGPPNHNPHAYNVKPTLLIPESSDLAYRIDHLEELMRQLEGNLDKERQDKVALMEELTILRETNQRLWEESLSSNEQLRKLSVLFNVAPGLMPRGNNPQY